jgi:hypothetical protein
MAEVIINHARLQQLMANDFYVQLLPPLAALKQKKQQQAVKKTCGRCGRATTPGTPSYNDFNTALHDLANFLEQNAGVRRQLKERLKTTQIKVRWKKADGTGYASKLFMG